jgi:riboflavin transporter FmnP
MLSHSLRTIRTRRPSGIIAGLTAAWAIFGLFLAIDSQLNVPPGTFYKMVGIAFGVDAPYAMYVGFLLYMITAVIISIIYNYISKSVRIFQISSVSKGIGTGILAGTIVWAVLFLPMNYYVIQPALSNMVNSLSSNASDYMLAEQLLGLSSAIVFGSLALHILFGGVMGFCSRLARV